MRRRGFSLIELALVLAIVAVAAGMVALGARGTLGQLGMETCVDGVTAFDRATRRLATEHDRPLRLVVDLAANRLRRTDAEGRRGLGEPLRMANGYRVAEVRLPGRRMTSGTVAVSVSARGVTPSYAVRLNGPGGRRRWVAVAGLTGQVWEPEDGDAVQTVFEAVGARRDAR